MPAVDARDDFQRARRAYFAGRAGGLLSGRGRRRTLPTFAGGPSSSGGVRRLEVIPLSAIVGTVDPTIAFDARFRPASAHLRTRWERVALAHRRGDPLPPITVLQGPDGYYVEDGRHRVSVALALGRRDIDAYVTGGAVGAAAEADSAAA
jgi:hypothetical protein